MSVKVLWILLLSGQWLNHEPAALNLDLPPWRSDRSSAWDGNTARAQWKVGFMQTVSQHNGLGSPNSPTAPAIWTPPAGSGSLLANAKTGTDSVTTAPVLWAWLQGFYVWLTRTIREQCFGPGRCHLHDEDRMSGVSRKKHAGSI